MCLQLRNKAPKRRVQAKVRKGRSGAVGPNDVWAMDFVRDQLFDWRMIRVLTIVDMFARLSPAIDVRQTEASMSLRPSSVPPGQWLAEDNTGRHSGGH
jgi:transposase InsO family protein